VLEKARRVGLLDEVSTRRRKPVLLVAEALEAERCANHHAALSTALAALALSPGFSPAAVLAARLLTQSEQAWRAEDILASAWTTNPIPALALAFAAIRPSESWQERAQRMRDLAYLNRDHFESRMLLAKQAIARNDGAEARRLLAPYVQGQTTTRLCAAMVEIEQLESEGTRAAHAWLTIARHARGDADWKCERCGVASRDWQALCPNCHAFDTLAWPSPPRGSVDRFAPATQLSPIDTATSTLTDTCRLLNWNAFGADSAGRPQRMRLHADNARFTPAPDDFGTGRFGFGPERAQ
jgi:HemY protein